MSKNFVPQDFMERVVAWPGQNSPGFVNLHWQPAQGHGLYGRPFKQVQEFMALARLAAAKPNTYKEVYFCLSTQRITGKIVHGEPIAARHATEALALKAIWADIDVKPDKGYASIDEVTSAIEAFLVAANLPPPSAVVYSGGGVHIYWFSTKALTLEEWRPYAHGLKAELLTYGVKCDAGLTTDPARVLRVPGTYNNKLETPRPVEVKWLGSDYDFANDPQIARLASVAPVPVTAPVTPDLGPMASLFEDGPADSLTAGIEPRSEALLKIEKVIDGCDHFRSCQATGGKDQSEPLWQLTLLACSFCEEGEALAHTFSQGHPGYTREETQAKYEQKIQQKTEHNLGWPACSTFEGHGANCKGCPNYQKIKSPLNLAERVIQVPFPAPLPPVDLMLPDRYVLNHKGWICELVTKKNKDETETLTYPLFMCKLRNPICQGGAGTRALLCETSLDQDKWGPVKLMEEHIATEHTMLTQLRRAGVKPFVPYQGRISNFMTSWMQKLDEAKARIRTVPFGWLREPGEETELGFAYGGRVFMQDGHIQQAGHPDPKLEAQYTPTGDVKFWYAACKMITDQKRPANEFIICMSFGSPLMLFTGKANCVAVPWSPETGAQKTTSQLIGQAVWAHPRLAKESVMSSKKGIIHKLGQLRHLPLYWDEISDDESMDKVRDLLGTASEGRGATVLQQNRTFFDTDEWETLILVGSNRSLVQNILMKNKGTDAPLQRVFEFNVPTAIDSMFEGDATAMIKKLEYNYGGVGLLYAQYLGNHPVEVRALVEQVYRQFCSEVAHTSAERFRAAMATCVYAGAKLANEQVGTEFNLPELWHFLKVEYMNQQKIIEDAEVVGGTAANTINSLTQFFKSCTRNALWIKSLPAPRAGKPSSVTHLAGPSREHPDPIHIRLAVNDKIIDVSRDKLQAFLKFLNVPASSVIEGLKRHFAATEMQRVNLAAGAGVLGSREHIIRIPVTKFSPFLDELYKHTPMKDRPPEAQDVTGPVMSVQEEAMDEAVSKLTNGKGPHHAM